MTTVNKAQAELRDVSIRAAGCEVYVVPTKAEVDAILPKPTESKK